jgi:hypothetical protein
MVVVLAGCAAATPARDANLAIQRGYFSVKEASERGDAASARVAINKMKGEYKAAVGESIVFDNWVDLWFAIVDNAEKWDAAAKRGEDVSAYARTAEKIKIAFEQLSPVVATITAQAQQDADRSAERRTQFLSTFGAVILGVGAGLASMPTPTYDSPTFQAPAYQPPINCVIRPAPTTSTGQPIIGGSATARCQ